LYTYQEIRSIVNEYVTAKGLVNAREPQYINVDALLTSTLTSAKSNEDIEFLKRTDVVQRLVDRMQSWYEIQAEGQDTVVK
jgi:translation initiation factor 2D